MNVRSRLGVLALMLGAVGVHALDPSGDADTSFSGDGYHGMNVALRNTDAGGRGLAIQSDGKILITGDYWDSGSQHVAITRYNSDGSFDSSFGSGGEVKSVFGANDIPFAIAVQADGKIVIVGSVTNGVNEDYLVARYTSSGTLDSSFGGGDGYFTLQAALGGNTFDRARALALQADSGGQKIVVAGYSTIGAGDERDAVVFRLTPAGVLDTTFSGDGIAYVSTSSGSAVDEGLGVAVTSSGLIYLSGRSSTGGHISRLTNAGVLDTSFSGDGIAINNPLSGTRYSAVAIDSSGRPVLAGGGGGSSQFIVARFELDGDPDPTFSGDGWISAQILAGQSRANSIGIDSLGNIYAGGNTDTDNSGFFQFFALRLTDTGVLDSGFSGDGKIAVDPSGLGLINLALSGGIQSDGKYVLGGSSSPAANPSAPRIAVLRFTTAGVLDSSFDTDGIVFRQLQGGSVDVAYGLAVDGSSNVLLTGYSDVTTHSDVAVVRLTSAGVPDTNWDSDGVTLVGGTSTFDEGRGVAVQGDGKVVVGAQRFNTTSPFNPRLAVFRFNSNGSPDSSYDSDGVNDAVGAGNTAQAAGAILDNSGRALVFGQEGDSSGNDDLVVARFTTSGARDASFDGDGKRRVAISASYDGAHAAAMQSDNKIVLGGFTTVSGGEHWALVRLLDDGTPDPAFNGDGNADGVIVSLEGSGNLPRARIRHVSILPDGKIYVVGSSNVDGANNRVRSGRYLANGAPDTSYGTNGFTTIDFGPNRIDNIFTGARQFDEKLIAMGAVTPSGSGTDFHLARINWDDGSLDTTYGTAGARQFAATAGRDIGQAGIVDTTGRALLAGEGNSGDLGVARFLSDPMPTPAGTPDLITASDSGRSNSDNITNDNTPTFTGTCVVGETVILYTGGVEHSPRTRHLCRSTTYTLTPPTLADGVYSVSVREINGRGQAALSNSISVTIDTVAAAPSITTPTANQKVVIPPSTQVIGAGAEADADVIIRNGSTELCNVRAALSPANNAAWTCTTSLGLGAYTLNVRQTDIAGNISNASTISFSQVVLTTATVQSSINPTRFGQTATFVVNVETNPAGFAIPSGCVVLTIGGTPTACLNLVGGSVNHATASLPVGVHAVSVSFAEQNFFLASNATLAGGHEVLKADTTTSVTSPTNPTVFGQTAMFVATVSAVSPGAGVPGGNVVFVVDGVAQAPVALDGSGQASYGSSALTVGSHSLVVNYLGDASYNPSNGALAGGHTVNRAATATGLVSALNPSTRGASVTFTATVSAVAPGAGTRTGMVDFFLDGAAMPSASVAVNAAGVASFNTSALSVGPHTLTASYAGDGNFLGSSGTLVPAQTVNKAASGTVVVSSLNPSTFGQGVTFTATVSAVAPSTDVPTGSVDFVIDGTPQSVALNGSGVATLATASLSAGNHTVQVDYAGDANLSSSSGTLAGGQVVNPAATTTTLSSSGSPTVFGQSVSFTATVAVTGAGVGTPSGTVQFVIDGGAPQPVALDGSGVATLSTSTLGVGSHTVAANYGASTNFSASNGTLAGGHGVNRGETTIAVGSSADPSVFGQNVTFTATVAPTAPAAGTPGGTVTFTIDGGAPSAPVALVGGQAQMSTSALAVGPHRIEVSYSGDGNFNTSNGAFDPQTVNRAATAAAVESATNPATLGQNVVFTATISPSAPGAGTPSGTVQFFLDGAVTPTATQALSGGVASYSSSALTVGTHSLSVTYSGDGNFTGSSANLTPDQTVNKNPSSTSLTTSLNPSPFADPLTFTATVTPVNPGPVATGTVHFVIDGGAPQPVGLDASGVATLTTSTLSGGSHSVVAQYQGDANLEVSSATLTPAQAITAATTSTAITSNANPASFGQTVDFTASVSATRPAAGTPNGTVQFVIDGGAPQLVALNGAGQATLSTNLLAVGNHSVSANYVGTSSYATSSASLSPQQTINEAASSTTLSSSANPAAQGASITWTATVAALPPASGTPSGAVHFVIDGNSTGPITLVGGVASFSSAALTPGPHTVVANYDGADANFLGSSGTLTPDQVVFPVDLGDAPAPYPTLSAHNGARHHAQGPRLGTVDSEPDGVPSALADGDDLNGSDDEDGVSFAGALIPGQNAALTVTASATAKLDGWIDFNNDGDWADLGEQVFAAHSLVASANALSLAVPASTVADSQVFARFRVSSAGGLAVDGFAADGEVEDYRLATSPVVDLQVSQSESIDPVVAGSGVGNLVYTVTVSNQGPSVASGIDLSENLTLPAGTSLVSAVPSQGSYAAGTWTLGSLAVNASATMTLTLTVDGSTVPASDAICSAAAVSAVNEPRLNLGDDSSTSCTSVTRQVDLALSQTESIDPVLAGSGASNLSYVLTVANAGPSAASAVVIGEVLTLPAGVSLASATPSQGSFAGSTWTLGNLAVGNSATLTLNLTVAANAVVGSDTICAAASISSLGESLINPGNDSASTCSSVSRQIDLQVDKTDSIDPVGAGSGSGNLVQTVSVHNLGVSDASGVVLSEAISLPAGVSTDSIVPSHGSYAAGTWTLGDLAAQASATLTVTYTVSAGAVAGDQICDTATVTASNEPRTNTGDDSATECTSIVRQTDLSLSKVADVSAIGAGQSITYTLTATNHGPGDATSVVVSDTLPAALSVTSSSGCAEPLGVPVCTLGAIANGASKSFTVTVTVNPAPPGLIVNTASVSGAEPDPNPGNNSASARVSTDTIAPTLVLDSLGATADGVLRSCETILHPVDGATIQFSEAMFDPPGHNSPGDVSNPAHYRLLRAAPGALFSTHQCSDPPGSDVVIPLGVAYDAGLHQAVLQFGALRDGIHRLLLCGDLVDTANNAIVGDSGPGSDAVRSFRVDQKNWLAAGHFDTYDPVACASTPWTSSAPTALTLSAPPDAEGSPLSGSAHNTGSSTGFDLGQCAALPPGHRQARLQSALRIDAAPGTLLRATPTCTYYAQPDCAGAAIGETSAPVLIGQTANQFLRFDQATAVPAGAASVYCQFTLARATGSTFNAYLDQLHLGPETLFGDSFE